MSQYPATKDQLLTKTIGQLAGNDLVNKKEQERNNQPTKKIFLRKERNIQQKKK